MIYPLLLSYSSNNITVSRYNAGYTFVYAPHKIQSTYYIFTYTLLDVLNRLRGNAHPRTKTILVMDGNKYCVY